MKRIRTTEDRIIDAIVYTVMFIVLICTIYPFFYVLIISFNDGIDATKGGIFLWPRVFSTQNYTSLLADSNWINAIFISIARTIIGTALGVFATSIVAYALSFKHVIGRDFYFKVFIFTMYFGGGIIPFYVLLRQIKLLNTFWVYVVPGMINVYYILIMVNFYREVPYALYESAWIEGAGDMRVYFTIAFPLSKAALATIALFYGVHQWNSWMDSVYFVQKAELRPLAYLMMDIINRAATQSMRNNAADIARGATAMRATSLSLQMAAMVVAVAPILAIYPFLQKYFVKGVMIGSVKG